MTQDELEDEILALIGNDFGGSTVAAIMALRNVIDLLGQFDPKAAAEAEKASAEADSPRELH